MNIHLAGVLNNSYLRNNINDELRKYYLLESFYYLKNNKKVNLEIIKNNPNFLLDSGAFTYIHDLQKKTDWEQYIKEYAQFIIDNEIIYFFELDIDSVVGLNQVEEYRKRLELLTDKKSIPVFHVSRGKDYFIKMCQEYEYVAIGGLITDGLGTKLNQYLPWFIKTAHEHNTKIHGLGFFNTGLLQKYHFDSVDSTTWNMCAKFGEIMKFETNKIVRYKNVNQKTKTRKIKNINEATIFNFNEWLKYQKYAKQNFY